MNVISTHSLRGFAALIGLTLMASGAALWAQTAPDDAALIDLGPIMNAPVENVTAPVAAAPVATPAAPVVQQPPPPAEVLDESLLTLPAFDRGVTVDPVDAPQAMASSVLLPIQALRPTLDGIVRLTGEVQRADFFLDLPLIAAPRDLVLSYRISINVLPEESQILIRVNGVDLPPMQPTAFEGFEQIVLPGVLLQDGRNDISVQVIHAHRIFCGPDATFAVWSEINTNTSGVRMARTDLPDDAAGMLMALRAQVAMAGNLAVRVSDDLSADLVIAALAPRLTGLRGSGAVALVPEQPYGVANDQVPMARITAITGPEPRVDVRRVGDGAVVMLVTVGFDGTLPQLETILPVPAPAANNPLLVPGLPTTLRDLGFDQPEAFNRYTEQIITFRMPDDWLLLASQKGMLQFGYSFADGLPDGALMLIKMNDTTIRLLPLDRDGGRVQPILDVDFRARLLRPGANALTFVTIVPGDPPDMHCPPLTGPLVTISPSSTLMVPPSPQMRNVDVARPLLAVQPDQIKSISDTARTGDDTGLAAAFVTALRPVDQVARLEDASLSVISPDMAVPINLADIGVSRRDLMQVFSQASGSDPAADTSKAAPEPAQPGLIGRATGAVRGLADLVVHAAVPGDGPLDEWLAGRQAEALLFLPDDDAPNALWLMVRSDTDPQRLGALVAQARLSATGPQGRFALLTPQGTWENWHSTRTPPQMLEPITIANFRAVAGNYASWSPLLFGALLLGLTVISVALALVFVITTRGKRKR